MISNQHTDKLKELTPIELHNGAVIYTRLNKIITLSSFKPVDEPNEYDYVVGIIKEEHVESCIIPLTEYVNLTQVLAQYYKDKETQPETIKGCNNKEKAQEKGYTSYCITRYPVEQY